MIIYRNEPKFGNAIARTMMQKKIQPLIKNVKYATVFHMIDVKNK